MKALRSVGAAARSLEEALAIGGALVEAAARDGRVLVAASVIEGPCVVLGAAQRAGRVVDLEACEAAGARVVRRSSTGTAAFVGGTGIWWSLALPDVAALIPDATARTLLNRNARPFLRALTGAGLPAHYFGREWIAVKRVPAALLGFDVTREGAVLLDVIAGFNGSIAIPGELAAPLERAVERWRGKAPEGLVVLRGAPGPAVDLARRVADGVIKQAGIEVEEIAMSALDLNTNINHSKILDPLDPIPAGLAPAPPLRAPIGWIEAAASAPGEPPRAWLGGDALAPRWLLEDLARTAISAAGPADSLSENSALDVALEGAALSDLREALRQALPPRAPAEPQ